MDFAPDYSSTTPLILFRATGYHLTGPVVLRTPGFPGFA